MEERGSTAAEGATDVTGVVIGWIDKSSTET